MARPNDELYDSIMRDSMRLGITTPSRADLDQQERAELAERATSTLISLERISQYSSPLLRSVSQGESSVLLHLSRHTRDNTPARIAEKVGLTRARLTQIVAQLEAEGLITKESDGTDKRKVRVALTEKGRAAVREHEEVQRGLIENYLMLLGPEDAAEVARILSRTYDILSAFDLSQASELLRSTK